MLRKTLKWGALVLVVLVGGLAAYVGVRKDRTFDAPLPALAASDDPAVIERGRYLVYGPAHCGSCHIAPDKLAEAEAGVELPLVGGFTFELPLGKLYAPNLTPCKETGIGRYSDGEIARVLRHGVRPDGRAVFPLMPFQNLSDEDVVAVLSFLRAQPPVRNAVPDHEYSLLGDMVRALALEPVGPTGVPPKQVAIGDQADYGKYLSESVANCVGCHTDRDLATGEFIGPPYAGGLRLEALGEPGMVVVSPNLTPDPKTGRIAKWSEADFIARMRAGATVQGTHMPWASYRLMSDSDLRAIYRHLMSVPPVMRENGPPLQPIDG